ncbi:MAG: FAD-dependent oxidoreductase [Candidatus Sumerlaeota bacterium]|nr:FAD-dependent oxidoreductase [Candidatus Sumerlaeota bacterium]
MSSVKKIVIVGGVAGGASAAARARRLSEEAEIIVLERGPYISFANCGLPYHIAGTISERQKLLVQTPEGFRKRFRIVARVNSEVTGIDRERKEVHVRDHAAKRDYVESYDALLLSPGAEPVRPPIPGANSPRIRTLRSLSDMDAIITAIAKDKTNRALIVGGGYIGLEMAEAFVQRGLKTTLVEMAPQVMGPVDPEMAAPIHNELKLNGVDLRLETSVTSFNEQDGALAAQLSNGDTVTCGLAIMAIGVRPESRLAREAGLDIGPLGGIAVDANMRTSDPNIYAVGDAVEVKDFVSGTPALIPLAGPANRQGRIAADNMLGRSSVYRATQGTAICKVFNLAIGMTGQSEKALKRAGAPYQKVYVHPASHASYYPGASPVSLKLLFHPETGKILGAQAVGSDGVDKRIDALAMALRGGMTVYDLEEAELCYAPPYGSARDVINYAGFAAANALRGDVRLCHAQDAVNLREDQALLDVRTKEEVAAGTIPGAINVPIDELRGRLGELPKGKELLVFCQVGLRGYLGCRILTQHGFPCANLSGGYKTYLMATGHLPSKPAPKAMQDDTGEKEAPAGGKKKDELLAAASQPAIKIDACGLQCPGPIVKLKEAMDAAAIGQRVEIVATDPGFAYDVPAWCQATGHELLEVAPDKESKGYRAVIAKRSSAPAPAFTCGVPAPAQTVGASSGASVAAGRKMTIVVFSGDFDKAMAAFIIANGAAAMGYEPTLFFTFWGLNILRKAQSVPVSKNLIERMFGWMMPRGAEKLALSKMNMAGMGLAMIKGIMRKKGVASLPELIQSAQKAGARLVACNMSMDLMGLKREEFIEGIEEGGVSMYLGQAGQGNINLFV